MPATSLQSRHSVLPRVVYMALLLSPAGCFYTAPINDQPDAEITKLSPGPHYPGQPIELDASKSTDDRRASAEARWMVFVCDSVTPRAGCDPEPLASEPLRLWETFAVTPPDHRPLEVQLRIEDERGAMSPPSMLAIEVGNQDPGLELQARGNQSEGGSFVLARPLQIGAGATDPDGDAVTLDWQLEAPAASVPEHRGFLPVGEHSYELVPDVSGVWRVIVTADDGFGGVTSEEITIVVDADQPPCIELTAPEAVADAAYVLGAYDDPRRFSVLQVVDDLHPYPPLADGDPVTGEPIFSWLLAGPDSDRFALVADDGGADFVLDPAAFAPGDRLQLRVEIDDTGERELSCADDAPTCELESGSGCVQRVTWEVEIR